jgi:epoxyqueuosine reductase
MRILVHLCCAPCSTYSLRALSEEGHDLLGFFFNPNIHPFGEYLLRRRAMEDYSRRVGFSVIWPATEEMESFFQAVAFHEEERCRICYRMRLSRTAEEAKVRGCDAFTTTLLISPYQKHDLLCEVGSEVAREVGMLFHYTDFRPGWRSSREEARQLGLYRQTYCGCLYSEKERQWERLGKKGWTLVSTPSASS